MCLHLTSLPGPYGIGEIGAAAREFVDKMAQMELSVWQFLPVGPTAYGDSPYQPLSTFAGNEMLVDIGELVDLGLLDEDEVFELTTLPHRYVDYGALIPIKSRLLRLAASRFEDRADMALKEACDRFVADNDRAWLHGYALYRILKTKHDERPWPDWKSRYVRREAAAIDEIESSADGQMAHIKVVQFLFLEQWQRLRDYAHAQRRPPVRRHADLHRARQRRRLGASARSCRLDQTAARSQWPACRPTISARRRPALGQPALRLGQATRPTGYRWWIDRLRATAELADLVRIDHFRGFEAYWSVPAELRNRPGGTWEPGPGRRDSSTPCRRHSAPADRGRGPRRHHAGGRGPARPPPLPGMARAAVRRRRPGIRIWRNRRELRVLHRHPRQRHDRRLVPGQSRRHPFRVDEISEPGRQRLESHSAGTPKTIHLDMIRAAFASRSRLAIAPMQDYLGLGSEARINVPGTSSQ